MPTRPLLAGRATIAVPAAHGGSGRMECATNPARGTRFGAIVVAKGKGLVALE